MNRLRRFAIALAVLVLAAAGGFGAPGPGHLKKTRTAAKSGLVDVNHASVADLATLPGVGDVYAAKIVKNRPYANKTQLLSKGVLPAATYKKIRPLVIARQ